MDNAIIRPRRVLFFALWTVAKFPSQFARLRIEGIPQVEQIKEASADGKITDDEKKRIKEKAIAAVKAHLGTKGLSEVGSILGLEGGALDGLLSSKVEAAVHDLRRAAAVANGVAKETHLPLAPAPAA